MNTNTMHLYITTGDKKGVKGMISWKIEGVFPAWRLPGGMHDLMQVLAREGGIYGVQGITELPAHHGLTCEIDTHSDPNVPRGPAFIWAETILLEHIRRYFNDYPIKIHRTTWVEALNMPFMYLGYYLWFLFGAPRKAAKNSPKP